MAPHASDLSGMKHSRTQSHDRSVGRLSDGRASFIARLGQLLSPVPGRLQYAARLALICTLTALIVEIYETPSAALSVYVAFFLNKPDRTESLLVDTAFLMLISLIIGFTTLVAMVVVDAPLWRLIAMTVISVAFLFLASASKLRPLGAIIAMIIAYGLDVLGTVHGGELATRGLLYAWLFVSTPAGVSIVVNFLFAPPPRLLAERAIARRLRLTAEMLRAPDEAIRRAFMESIREGVDEIHGWLKLAGMERTAQASDLAALKQATRSTAEFMLWVEAAHRFPADKLPDALRTRVATTLEEMSAILLRGSYPIDIAIDDPGPDASLSVRSAGIWSNIKHLLEHFAEPPSAEQRDAQSAQAKKRGGGFLLPDAFTNPNHVQYALKTTAAAIFCYVLYSLLDWPGIHTCFITCYIVSLATAGETIEKLTLRILGCLVGAAAGLAAIVFLLPSLTSIQELLAVVFVGALASAWIAAGSPRISYAGFQVAFAFFLCVIQGPAPAFDLTVARDRIIGVLIGNLVVYFVFTRLWPVSVGPRVDAAITDVLRHLSAMSKAVSSVARGALAVKAQAVLETIEGDLQIARYEPASIRPTEGWLQARRQAAAEIDALAAPLLVLSSRAPPNEDAAFAGDVARRLEGLADGASAMSTPLPPHPLAGLIDTHLRKLDAVLMQQPAGATVVTGHAPT
ncbi:FUSC family protein [Steroidobacter cummioxidans]|uniref:FUSC family protein n=1 Tax=Steroidobacter cummioxidans TaxID=1803913 RepID=UPI0019D437DF|nr:FUSC family protein [Steroidobacter cummioxidans]